MKTLSANEIWLLWEENIKTKKKNVLSKIYNSIKRKKNPNWDIFLGSIRDIKLVWNSWSYKMTTKYQGILKYSELTKMCLNETNWYICFLSNLSTKNCVACSLIRSKYITRDWYLLLMVPYCGFEYNCSWSQKNHLNSIGSWYASTQLWTVLSFKTLSYLGAGNPSLQWYHYF